MYMTAWSQRNRNLAHKLPNDFLNITEDGGLHLLELLCLVGKLCVTV